MGLKHNTIECASKGCFAVITMHPQEEDRLRRTHETFYCPAGHSNYFPGKTKQEKRIEELEARVESHEATVGRFRDLWHDAQEQRHEALTTLKQCPLRCGWHSRKQARAYDGVEAWERGMDRIARDIIDHLADVHGVEIPAETEDWLAA